MEPSINVATVELGISPSVTPMTGEPTLINFMTKTEDWKEQLLRDLRNFRPGLTSEIRVKLDARSLYGAKGMTELVEEFEHFGQNFPCMTHVACNIVVVLQYINVGGPDGIRALAGILKYAKTLDLFNCDLGEASSFKALGEIINSPNSRLECLFITGPSYGGLPSYIFYSQTVLCDVCMRPLTGPGCHIYPLLDFCTECYEPGTYSTNLSPSVLAKLKEKGVVDIDNYLKMAMPFPQAEDRVGNLGGGGQDGVKAILDATCVPGCPLKNLVLYRCDLGKTFGAETSLRGTSIVELTFRDCANLDGGAMDELGATLATFQGQGTRQMLSDGQSTMNLPSNQQDSQGFSLQLVSENLPTEGFFQGIAASKITKLRLHIPVETNQADLMRKWLPSANRLETFVLYRSGFNHRVYSILAEMIPNCKMLKRFELADWPTSLSEALLWSVARSIHLESIRIAHEFAIPYRTRHEIGKVLCARRTQKVMILIAMRSARVVKRLGLNSRLRTFPEELLRRLGSMLPFEFRQKLDLSYGTFTNRIPTTRYEDSITELRHILELEEDE